MALLQAKQQLSPFIRLKDSAIGGITCQEPESEAQEQLG
jgi:hypothetical protein